MIEELVVDTFAGAGGASTGIAQAIGRDPDIAINHWPAAIAMHRANHPGSRHYCENVFRVSPREACGGRPVGFMWLSPDCTHHSKAKGGKPRKTKIRGLAWVAIRWAKEVRPRVIVLENVEEFEDWGPLDENDLPCPRRRGQTFRSFVSKLRGYGYRVEWRNLVAADYGAPTTRKRLFLIARCNGAPIVWPKPTHGRGRARPWRTAAEIIDWSIPCPSIFERKRPLADATLRRIATGMRRFVLETPRPFIAPFVMNNMTNNVPRSLDQPLATILTGNHKFLVAPTLIQTGYGEREGQTPRVPGLEKPLGTVVCDQKHALVAAFITKHFGSPPHRMRTVGSELHDPTPTVTARDHNALTTAFITKFYGECRHGVDMRQPLPTVTARGWHLGEVRALLERFAPSQLSLGDRDVALVSIEGELYAIADIGMRMLQPHELFAAQGFPSDYQLDVDLDAATRHPRRPKRLTKTELIALAGNSVCPDVAREIVLANYVDGAREVAA